MAVQYRGKIPDKNYSVIDFYNNGVVISWFAKFKDYNTKNSHIKCIFRSNGLLGEIRTTCYGNSFAVDVRSEWRTQRCLTTECKSLREAKSILFMWFKEQGFSIPKHITDKDWNRGYLTFNNVQLNLNPILFK